MLSYISSFRYIAIFFATVILSISAYSFGVKELDYPVPIFGDAQEGWRDQVQNLRSDERLDVLLVGSSIVNSIPNSFLPVGVGKLALSGGSVLTALAILAQSEELPRVVVVEVNVLHRGLDENFLFRTASNEFAARTAIPALRARNAPFVVIEEAILRSARTRRDLMLTGACRTFRDRDAWVAARARMVESGNRQERWGDEQTIIRMYNNANQLRVAAEQLAASGVEVRLLRYPIHPEVQETTYYKVTSRIIDEVFSETELEWIAASGEGLIWYDGMHYTWPAGLTVLHEILQNVSLPQSQAVEQICGSAN
jgi:hypothetical protein